MYDRFVGSARRIRGRPIGSVMLLLFGLLLIFKVPPVAFARMAESLQTQGPAVVPSKLLPAAGSLPGGVDRETAGKEQTAEADLLVIVVDENGVAVPYARVTLSALNHKVLSKEETDYTGRCRFRGLSLGAYRLDVEKEGFYTVKSDSIRVGAGASTEVRLNHVREFFEKVNVVASPVSIDPAKTTSTHELNSQEIINLPFSVPRDIRYALPMLPGVVQDATGQVHVNGSSTTQILDNLDGFNITDPASGFFDARVPVEALRSVAISSGRAPAQDGKASGGVLDLTTGMGDDRYRFVATDFVPSISTRRGFHINTWTPRGSFSGPLKRGKAWFLLAPEGEYNLNVITDLPSGSDQNSRWRIGDLAKMQINLTPSNILTASFLMNRFRNNHDGLSRFNPVEATTNQDKSINHFSIKDQTVLSNGVLMEYGVAFNRFHAAINPLGNQTYVITPETTSGNFFKQEVGRSERTQAIANFVAPTVQQWGSHEFRVGMDLNRVVDVASFNRHGILIRREDGTTSREVSFPGSPSFSQANFETGLYAQDHWSLSKQLIIDPGIRSDWDQIIPGARVSPRLAMSILPTANGDTKIVAGAGVYYDDSNLELYTEPQAGIRIDTFFDSTGQTLLRPPVQTVFQIDRQDLSKPWFLNWSAGIERKLPAQFFLRTEYIEKRGYKGWTYANPCAGPSGCFAGQFFLRSRRQDRYNALEVTVRRQFKGGHMLFASYTRSDARSNAVLEFNVDNPYFSPQVGGRLPWDVPNRVISWGIMPLVKQFDLAYTLDWHNGFPFGVVNENQELIGAPDRLHFPTYFSLNVALERRVALFGFQWRARVGFENITNRSNPGVVDNNIDSPTFLTFGSPAGRSLTGEVRLLGRK